MELIFKEQKRKNPAKNTVGTEEYMAKMLEQQKRRYNLVKQVMLKKNLTYKDASQYVKENGLFKRIKMKR